MQTCDVTVYSQVLLDHLDTPVCPPEKRGCTGKLVCTVYRRPAQTATMRQEAFLTSWVIAPWGADHHREHSRVVY